MRCLPTFTYIKQPLHRYTFKAPKTREWVESKCYGKVLNLFAGNTKLSVNETRIDADSNMNADVYMDALSFVRQCKDTFDTVILDPPYSYRKSMEKYNGRVISPFCQLKDALMNVTKIGSKVITFGYHSNSMGEIRGFSLMEICLICHGGAQHDTIAIVEERIR